MDAVRLLGSLLGSGGMGGSVGQNVLGSLLSGGGGGAGGGGAAGMLGSLLGGGQQQGAQQQGGAGMGGALGSLLGSQGGQSGGGGLLGNVVRGALAQQGGGGAGGALAGLLGGNDQQQQDPFGGMQQQEVTDQATILVRAMCNAAKADGNVDASEQEKILGRLGDNVGEQEVAFLKNELQQPLDVAGFVQQVPQQLAPQVYAMSVMAIEIDTQEEAGYLGKLAQGLGLSLFSLDLPIR